MAKKKLDAFDKLDAWDMYESSMMEQQELERTLPETMGHASVVATQGATHDFADEIAGAAGAMVGDDYTEARDEYRNKVDESREYLGGAADLIEAGGNVASTLLIPAGRAGKAGTEIALAAAQGAGAAEEFEDIPEQMGKSATMAGATQIAGKGASKILGYDQPAKKLARVGGARGQDFLKKGVEGVKETRRAPELVAKRLDDLGFWRQGKVVWDNTQKKFVPEGGRISLERYFQPQSLDDLHNRATQAVTAIKTRNNQLVKGKPVKMDKLAETLREAVEDYIPDGYDYTARTKTAANIVGTILNDLEKQGKIKRSMIPSGLMKPTNPGTRVTGNNMFVDAGDIEDLKRHLYAEIKQTFGQGKSANDLSLNPEAQRKFSAKLDELLDEIGGPEYKRNNEIMSDLLTQSDTMFNKLSRESGYGIEGPRLTMGSQFVNGVKDMTVNNVPAGVGMARLGQLPDTVKGQAVRNYVERLPVEMINNHQRQTGREPQSVANIPEHFIRTPLPRTTEELMQNKNFVLGKVAQMAPEMFEGIKDVYDNDPERLSELAPVLAQKMPHLFTRDKYNRFDGRIMSEQDKNRAIKDTLSDTSLNSIQQAEIISKLTKDGTYDR
jgi:hypothetical protein